MPKYDERYDEIKYLVEEYERLSESRSCDTYNLIHEIGINWEQEEILQISARRILGKKIDEELEFLMGLQK